MGCIQQLSDHCGNTMGIRRQCHLLCHLLLFGRSSAPITSRIYLPDDDDVPSIQHILGPMDCRLEVGQALIVLQYALTMIAQCRRFYGCIDHAFLRHHVRVLQRYSAAPVSNARRVGIHYVLRWAIHVLDQWHCRDGPDWSSSRMSRI